MSDRSWRKGEVHEALVGLYLRLNGYFTTGLIVHAPDWGKNRAQIDCLAIRHPNHAQPDRLVGPSPFLAPHDGRIDLLICEVKSAPEEVAFNDQLRTDPGVIEGVLKWAGVLKDHEIPRVARQLQPILSEGLSPRFPTR